MAARKRTKLTRRQLWSALRQALRQNRVRLESLPNVDHLGIGTKRTKGEYVERPSIIVFVKAKGSVARKDKIPSRVKYTTRSGLSGWIATDVVEMKGDPQLFGMRAGDYVVGFDGDRGVCSFAFSVGLLRYAVTNAHVVCAMATGRSGPAAWVDWQSGQILGGGRVQRFTAFNTPKITADAALIELNANTQTDNWQILRTMPSIVEVSNIVYDDRIQYFYVAGGEVVHCARPIGIPIESSARVRVDGQDFLYSDFWRIPVTQGQAMPGHSGALVMRLARNGYAAAGIAFGGIEPGEIWAFSARKIWDVLGVDQIIGRQPNR